MYASWLAGSYDLVLNPVSDAEALASAGLGGASGVLALAVTGGTERLIQAAASLGKPMVILAHESMNSLPAALEAASSLGPSRPPQLLFGQGEAELRAAKRFVSSAKALNRIRKHKIGLVGGPSSWLTYSLPNEAALSGHLGIEVVTLPMEEFDSEYVLSGGVAASMSRDAQIRAPVSDGITKDDFDKSAKVYASLRSLLEKHDLTSLSVRCFDFIGKYGATGCYGVAMLNDQGIVAGCEGDIPATVAMLTLSEVSGSPTFLANPSSIEGRKLTMAHCTIAPKLTKGYRYRTHFESGLGVAISGSLREGERVTVVRFSNDFGVLRAGEGIITRGEAWSEKLCRTQVEITMDGNAELIRERPMGNHLVIAYGSHLQILHGVASLAGIEFEAI